MHKIVPVLMSGGMGTRLWPISNRYTPKPFVRLPSGDRLIDLTYRRASVFEPDHIVTFTNRRYDKLTQEAATSASANSHAHFHLVLEDDVKNTAPVIITAAEYISRHIGSDALMLVMPADHLIEDTVAFGDCVRLAAEHAETGALMVFGLKPRYAETNYGYIRVSEKMKRPGIYPADGFKEKPSAETAAAYVKDGGYFWNMGIFCFRADAVIRSYQTHCPEMPAIASRAIDAETAMPSPHMSVMHLNRPAFAEFKEISVDYAIMEKDANVCMVKADFGWRDMGSWRMIREAESGKADKHGNISVGNNLLIDTQNTFVWGTCKPIAAIGLDNLTIAETPNAILISKNSESAEIKAAYEHFETPVLPDKTTSVCLMQHDKARVDSVQVLPGKEFLYKVPYGMSIEIRVLSGMLSVADQPHTEYRQRQSLYLHAQSEIKLCNYENSPLLLSITVVYTLRFRMVNMTGMFKRIRYAAVVLTVWICAAVPAYPQDYGKKTPYGFAQQLASEGDYYRTSEVLLPLLLKNPAQEKELKLFLESAYHLKDTGLTLLLLKKHPDMPPDLKDRILKTVALTELRKGEPEQAQIYLVQTSQPKNYAVAYNPEAMLDPDKVAFRSSVLPGLGLVYTGAYGKAAGVFLLNIISFGLAVHSYQRENYGAALLFGFFGYQFYRGGVNASRESAEQYNSHVRSQAEQQIALKLETELFKF
ncbi:hypothetical protein CHS0354_026788 [Potamilus streckersoni]|uniref:Mannose-1-phosphate guanylyltransferase n=1 Tax=Potamilus streckersoni TaxID=2493646 RepID=A0AAE0W861_9BIVA|nr:hypothetical protein CHS0354_026788 [Potamilus streckersoni]